MRNKGLKFLFPLMITVLLSLACNFMTPLNYIPKDKNQANNPPVAVSSDNQASNAIDPAGQAQDAPNQSDQQGNPAVFSEADCNVSGVTFDPISYDYMIDDTYDGGYLTCSYSATGAHGLSETVYLRIVAYKADKLDGFYQDLKENIQGYVNQSNEWNAQPDLPADAKDEITIIRDDSDGYVFMITKNANVQGCTRGNGYGVEKIKGKYMVQLVFTSCEGDPASYLAKFQDLQAAATAAISRAESSAQP